MAKNCKLEANKSKHIAPVARPKPCDKHPSSGLPLSEKNPLNVWSMLVYVPIEMAKQIAVW